jgi:NTP pyrophosphatase (non-canonical NTP hydrolase)
MNFNQYQKEALKTAIFPPEMAITYPALGLAGETGEVMEKIKKMYRDNLSFDTVRHQMAAELGDVLWYVAVLADAFDIPLQDIVTANVMKLRSRYDRGVISGSGDDR